MSDSNNLSLDLQKIKKLIQEDYTKNNILEPKKKEKV